MRIRPRFAAGLVSLLVFGTIGAAVPAVGLAEVTPTSVPGLVWGLPVRAAVTPYHGILTFSVDGLSSDGLLTESLVPLRHFTGNPSDPAWVLFAWWHDGAHMLRWTSNDELLTENSFSGLQDLTPLNGLPDLQGTFHTSHLAAGDVLWSDELDALISTPHHGGSSVPGESGKQCSVMMSSADGGLNWEFLGSAASGIDNLPCPDGVPTFDYGRMLRTLEGKVTTQGGKYLWLVRAQHGVVETSSPVTADPPGDFFIPILGSSSTLAGPYTSCPIDPRLEITAKCSPFPTPSGNKSLFAIGSYLKAPAADGVDRQHVYYTHGIPTQQIVNISRTAASDTFIGPGVPVALPPTAPSAAPYTGQQGQILQSLGYVVNNPYASGAGIQYLASAVNVVERAGRAGWAVDHRGSRGEVWIYTKLG